MTLIEAHECKQQMENKIQEAINDFENQTGLEVETFEMIKANQIGAKPKTLYCEATVRMSKRR